MQQRKTMDVADIVDRANHFMLASESDQMGQRQGVAGLLESVLFATGNYKGFRYVDQDSDETVRHYFGGNN